MLFRLPCSAQKECAIFVLFLRSAALITVLTCFLLFSGCGASGPVTNPTNTSTPNLTISTTLPAASVGSNYSATVTVTGGTAPYGFSLASGELPKGVVLSATSGTISGTPSASGTFSFALSVSDSKGTSKQQSLQMTVSNNPAPSGQNGANSFSNVQRSGGWNQFGQGPPDFVDCSPSPCNGIAFSMTQGIASPSMSGQATVFWL